MLVLIYSLTFTFRSDPLCQIQNSCFETIDVMRNCIHHETEILIVEGHDTIYPADSPGHREFRQRVSCIAKFKIRLTDFQSIIRFNTLIASNTMACGADPALRTTFRLPSTGSVSNSLL